MLGWVGEVKNRFSLESGYIFCILGYHKLSCFLRANLDHFWLHFGMVLGAKIDQVGVRRGSKCGLNGVVRAEVF